MQLQEQKRKKAEEGAQRDEDERYAAYQFADIAQAGTEDAFDNDDDNREGMESEQGLTQDGTSLVI